MTQEKINKYFESELGQQLDTLFSTSDDMVFIRKSEAMAHASGHDGEMPHLIDMTIIQWFYDEEPEIITPDETVN